MVGVLFGLELWKEAAIAWEQFTVNYSMGSGVPYADPVGVRV